MTDLTEITEKAKTAAGGPSALARSIGGITSQAVSGWRKIPMERVFEVARITGIPAHRLRPDVIPRPRRDPA